MKLNKKAFFQIHSWIGIKLSILIFIVCFSGTLATLSHEMDWLFIPEIRANVDNFDVTHQQKIKMLEMLFPMEPLLPGRQLTNPTFATL